MRGRTDLRARRAFGVGEAAKGAAELGRAGWGWCTLARE